MNAVDSDNRVTTEKTSEQGLLGQAGQASRYTTLIVTTMASFLTPFMGSSVNIALPAIAHEFSMSAVALSWIATAFLLSAAVFMVPMGKVADIYGRKKMFIYGISLYTLSSFLCGIAPSGLSLILFRIVQGFAGSMIFGTAVAILLSVFSPSERGRVLGINVSAVYAGLSLGPFVGGVLTDQLGWRSVFMMNVPLGIFILAAVLLKLKGEWAEARGERIDLTGSIIYGLSLLALTYGLSILPQLFGFILIVCGIIGITAFVRYEFKIDQPVIYMGLFRNNPVFTFSNLATLINYSATFALTFLLSLFLQYNKGYSPQATGLILVIQPVIMALFSPLAGKLSDRIEPRIVATAGMIVTVFGLVLLIFLENSTTLSFIIPTLALLGFGFALFSSPNTSAIMGAVEKKYYGVSSAIVGTMRLLGQVISMGIAMLVFSLLMGSVEITPSTHAVLLKSITICFSIFSVLCILGVFASMARGNLRS
ncbi:MFS transporter [bacterium]|nr:MFS transporter [bacterium]